MSQPLAAVPADPSAMANTQRQRFSRFAWFNLFYLVLVILWGAWVRISKSGNGCGAHWPNCNGEIIPLNPSLKTLIEFAHRLSSGLSIPIVLILLFWSLKLFPKGNWVRKVAGGTLFFLLAEAALGAALVKFELVGENASVARAIMASLHLVNTFSLSAMAALTAWWSTRPQQFQFRGPSSRWLLPALGALVLTSMMGAVTALGDTLFPTTIFVKQGLIAHLRDNLSATTHFLVQLRIVHPIIAVMTAGYLLLAVQVVHEQVYVRAQDKASPAKGEHPGAFWLTSLVVVQVLLGGINIVLAAPAWVQLLHLLMAVTIWLATLLYWVSGCAQQAQ